MNMRNVYEGKLKELECQLVRSQVSEACHHPIIIHFTLYTAAFVSKRVVLSCGDRNMFIFHCAVPSHIHQFSLVAPLWFHVEPQQYPSLAQSRKFNGM